MRVRARLGGDGRGVELVPADGKLVEPVPESAAAVPPIRARRYDGRLIVGFDDASGRRSRRQVDDDPAVGRAVENRRHVDAAAESVLNASRDIIAAGATEARRHIADSDLAGPAGRPPGGQRRGHDRPGEGGGHACSMNRARARP